MTAGQVFLVVWGVLATCLGALFLLRTDLVLRVYRWNLRNYPLGDRRRERMELGGRVPLLYRIGGGVFIMLGITVGTLAATGVIRPGG